MGLSPALERQIEAVDRGDTPPCADALFRRGDVVQVRRCKRLEHIPHEMVVLGDFPGASIVYLLVKEGEPQDYLVKEKDLTPTGKTVEIGSIKREGAEA
jgi:hypothetical protein